MKNKLSYLGFLGMLGLLGFMGDPVLFAFFGNFCFFSYARVVPDELFWSNVRTAATRAFFVFFILSNCLVALTAVLDRFHHPDAAGGFIVGTVVTVIVCELTFLVGLGIREADEKQASDED